VKRAFLHFYFKAGRTFNEVRLFGEGLKRHGWDVYGGDHRAFEGTDLICQWNLRNGELVHKVLDSGGEAAILETSYIEPRAEHCSLGFGYGINNRLRHYGPFEDGSRWERKFQERMKPWRVRDDGPVIIMGQMPGDMALQQYVNFYDWTARIFNELVARGHDVKFRPHPNASPHHLKRVGQRVRKWQKNVVHADEDALWRGLLAAIDAGMEIDTGKQPLVEALDAAKFVCTFNSNSGVDAVLNGCPAYSADPGSMAWDVTSHRLDDIVTPDREAWAHALAWKQYTREELESGEAWEHACPPHLR
jgi:hypothetical protein